MSPSGVRVHSIRKRMATVFCGAAVLICIIPLGLYLLSRENLQHRKNGEAANRNENISTARLVGERHWIVRRAALEAYLEDLTRLNRDLYLKPTVGAESNSVTSLHIAKLSLECPVYAAGMRENDRILKVNGSAVTTLSRAINLVHEVRMCSRLTVEVERHRKIIDFTFEFE